MNARKIFGTPCAGYGFNAKGKVMLFSSELVKQT
jgi:hypothetical protein